MTTSRSFRRRLTSVGAAVVLTAGMLTTGVVMSAPASADLPTTGLSPIAPHTSNVVTADALPTVQMDGVAWSQAITGSGTNALVWAGGGFANARPAGAAAGTSLTARSNLLAYTLSTGNLVTFAGAQPALNGQVLAVAASPDGTRIYVGGDFTTANGVTHNRLAAFNAATGALITTFNASADTRVSAIVATNTTVYAGGKFGSANGTTRTRLAAFNASNGNLTTWAPTADYNVTAMVLTPDGSRLIVGGAFANVDGQPAIGLAAISTTDGSLIPWAANQVVQDSGTQAGITSLSTDGTAIYGTGYVFGPGGNLEGTFSANPNSGAINWIEDCHGDTYSSYSTGQVVYTVSHAHYCGNIGGYPQSNPWAINLHHALAFTHNDTGIIGNDPLGYPNWAGNKSPSLINWFPDFTTGTYTGQGQSGWSVTGNGAYVVVGGEFPTVNNTAQQGLVRFATKPTAPAKSGPALTGSKIDPTLVSLTPGTVRVAFPSDWDRDDTTLTYKLVRNSNTAAPIYTTTAVTNFWTTPALGFTDTGLTPGVQYRYRLYVNDPDGNTVSSDTVTITLPTNTPPLTAYANDVLGAGAQHYWRLSEPSGTNVYDWAGFDDATLSGSVTQGAPGAISGDSNTATTFSGNSAFAADKNAVMGPDTFTESAWFNTTTTAGGKIVGFGDSSTGNSSNYDRHMYMDTNGYVYFGVYNNGGYTLQSPKPLNDGQWHQIIGTLSPAGMVFYVDGKQVGTNTGTTIGQPYLGYWRIGGDSSWSGANYFAGTIDDVAIYPSALSLAQVKKQYVDSGRTYFGVTAPADNYGKAVWNDGPSLFYPLDETSGTTATDYSGQTDDGVISATGVTQGVASPISGSPGTAYSFDGTTGTIGSTSSFNNPTTYSEELWFNTTTTAGGKLIGFGSSQTNNSGSYDRHVYMRNDGTLVFGAYTGQLNLASSTQSYNDGAWHYLVATQGADGMKLYVDNQLVGTNPQTQAQNYTGYWRIGGDSSWEASNYFTGTIDEPAVYPTVLTPAQINTHYLAASGINHAPTAGFTSSAVKQKASFDASASVDPDGTIASYSWDFGDGSAGAGVAPVHTYATGGSYNVKLTVTDNGGATNSVTKPITITANVLPTASFTSAVTKQKVAFDATGSSDIDGTVVAYAWDFGDGTTGTGVKPPVHSYATVGPFNVTLTVTDNDGGTASVTNTVLTTGNALPTAAFTSTAVRKAVSFDGTGSTDTDGTIASYAWDFGDGTTGTGATPNHTYATAGSFNVTLTVTDNDGGTGAVTNSVSTGANALPTASFTAAVTKLAVTFDGTGSADTDGTITSYAWDFGDGTTGTGATPNHTYATAGSFNVTLRVIDNDGGTGAVTHSVTTVANVLPTAAFTSVVTKQKAVFDASGSTDADGTIASYAWDFGDGITGSGVNPGHVYATAGSFNVTLTVTDDDGGTGAVTHAVLTSANVAPVAAFTSTVTKLKVAFNGSGSSDADGTVASYAWDFGDGATASGVGAAHTYASAGSYNVKLTVTDNDGGTGSVTQSVTAVANTAPTASFTSSASALAVAFDGSASADADGTISSYAWNFGDTTIGTGVTANHTYAAAGSYNVTLTVTDNDGASGAVTKAVMVSTPVVATDTFTRTATNAWASADTGGAWTLNGIASLFSVAGGTGKMKMATAGSGPYAFLNGTSALNVNGTVDVSFDSAPTGSGTYISLAGRRIGTSDYLIRVRALPTSTTIAVDKVVNGTETVIKTVTVAGLTYNVGDTLRMRLQITGTGAATISGKVWKTTATEPTAWQVSATDAEPTLQAAGGVGLVTYLSGTSTAPVVASFDNLSIGTNTTP